MLRLPNFNMLFQLVLTKFFKKKKFDLVIKSCKEPIAFLLTFLKFSYNFDVFYNYYIFLVSNSQMYS